MQYPDETALFRYQVISKVLIREFRGEPRSVAIRAVSEMEHLTVDHDLRRIGERSIYRWLGAYEIFGFTGLVSAERTRTEDSEVLPKELIDFIKLQKGDDPLVSVPELIRRAYLLGIIDPSIKINRTTVWRTLKRMGLDTRRHKSKKLARDSHRFAYPHRMNMVLCDGKHFRAGSGRLKRMAFIFLDDATRTALHVVVGTSENARLFLRGLFETIMHYGLMTALYVDNGPGFRADDAINVLQKLDILFIHGEKAYPEGRGKLERFNRTIKEQVLRYLYGNPEIDPECSALELRLRHYLMNQYNQTPHESLKKDTPWCRFNNDPNPLRFYKSREQLNRAFILHEKRKVSNDHVISFDGTLYEVMRGYAGKKIILHRNVLDGSIAVMHDNRLVKLSPVDLEKNAHLKRIKPKTKKDESGKLPQSSAEMSYNRDYKPMIDSEGGCRRNNEKN